MTYPPQQGQYGGYPQQQGPYGGPPPRKDKAPLIATLIFVVALLAGLGITGFVAPGFFLSDDDSGGGSSADGGATGDSDGAGSPGSGAGEPAPPEGGDADLRALAADLVAAANAKDKTKLREFPCPDARSGVNQAIAEIVTIDGAELRGVSEVDPETYIVGVDITYQGQSAPFAATMIKSGDGWCWQDFAPGSGGADAPEPGDDSDDPASGPGSGSGGSTVDAGSAEAFAGEFVAALNAKDGGKANGMYCPDATKGIVDYVVGKEPKLTLGTSIERGPLLEVLLKGTLDGNPLKRGKITVEMKNSNAPCVFTFSAG